MFFTAAILSTIVLAIPIISMVYFGLYLSEFSQLSKKTIYIIGNASGLISVAYVALMYKFKNLYSKEKGGSNERRNKSRQL